MGDVTVRIQGVGTSGGGGGSAVPPSGTPSVPPTPPGVSGTTALSGSSISAADNRMVEDLRRAILAYGAVYVPTNSAFKPILQTVEQQQRRIIDDDINQKYAERRADVDKRWDAATEANNVRLQAQREAELRGVTDKRTIERINAKWDKIEEDEQRRINAPFKAELFQIDKEASEERKEKQDELTQALQELTDAINKSGTLNPESYLGQLRQQRQQAIFERDTAEDEESARAAAQRVRDIDQQIKDVTDGRVEPDEKKINFGDRVLATLMGFDQLNKGLTGRNIGSAIMGAGTTLTSLFGASDETTAKTLAWLTPFGGLMSLFQEAGQRGDQMAGLAALTRGSDESIAEARRNVYSRLWGYGEDLSGTDIYEMGLSVPDFAASAEKRISQRGMSQNGISEAYFQEVLERVFSLDRGSLGAAGKYDRYGVYATDAIADLVSRLERISGSGVTQGNYARVQEYLGMQQDLMSNYMRFADKPSALIANRDLAAFASLDNYTVDTRTPGEIKAFQNMIVNPQNDRMKAILYSVVEDTIPEYRGQNVRGRTDLIDQIINDPQYQGLVEKAFAERLTSMYGGFDNPMGYWNIKSQLQGIESPERRKAIWEGTIRGEAGRILSTAEVASGQTQFGAKIDYSKEIKDYISTINAGMTELSDAVFNSVSYLSKIFEKIKTGIKVTAD